MNGSPSKDAVKNGFDEKSGKSIHFYNGEDVSGGAPHSNLGGSLNSRQEEKCDKSPEVLQ